VLLGSSQLFLGYKSIFGIADKAIIVSNEFAFSFDKRRELGTITPEWEKEFVRAQPQGTMQRYELSALGRRVVESIRDGTDYFDPTLMLFLQKLQILSFAFRTERKQTARTVMLSRIDPLNSREAVQLTRSDSRDNDLTLFFLLKTYSVDRLPRESRRPSAPHSTIVLAFPIDKDGVPLSFQCKIHAYLPLYRSGLKVCLHFLLQNHFSTCFSLVCRSRQFHYRI
jgi:hypothetical protein